MKSNFAIRPIRPDDYQHLLELHVAAVMAIDAAYYPSYMQSSTVLGMGSERFAKAVSNGEIFDLASDLITDQPLGYTSILGSELMNLFVHPKEQGRGIGKALLFCAEQRFASARIKMASLRASLSAAAFYTYHGWELVRIVHRRTKGGVIIEVAEM